MKGRSAPGVASAGRGRPGSPDGRPDTDPCDRPAPRAALRPPSA